MLYRFEEIQRFRQPWLWAMLIALQLLFLYGLVQQLILGKQFGDNPAPDILLVFLSLIPFFIIILFGVMHLKTTIGEENIEILFFPFTKVIINKEEIEKAQVREYKALMEYGGWGIRYGNGKAYTTGGNQGLQLQLKDGRKILIGTQKPTEIQQAIDNLLTSE
jgi:hypothetical protein